MGTDLIREINQYTKNLKCKRDWQVSRVYDLEHKVFAKEAKIARHEASKIVKKLERHWNMLITAIYPEGDDEYAGETWPISKKAAALNVYSNGLYPSVIVHEVSHGIVECCTKFHSNKLKEPGHGPFWCGVYAYNLNYILGTNMAEEFDRASIRVVDLETIEKFRHYFKIN